MTWILTPDVMLTLKPSATSCVAVFLVAGVVTLSHGQIDSDFAQFETHVRPVLAEHCIKCHGPQKQEAGLRLDSREALLAGGESGPAIVANEPQQSRLISAIRYNDLEMPPDGKLDEQIIRELEKWILAGAVWSETGPIRADKEITSSDRDWWAFQPLAKPEPPPSAFPPQAVNEVDAFIHRRLASARLTPSPAATKETLVRRLYQDVIGLPPTPDQIDAFLRDESEDAYEKLVDRLLSDERYGEHWARFWLDLVRYAESDGWKADAYRPHIWRYRDYVVNAFNADKPYPEFVRQQLAGDELSNPTPEDRAATGYLRLGIFEYNQRNSRQHWDDILNEITDVTGDVFLGMGLACARCHDHKFDPVLQLDYFKLRAFFEPIVFDDDAVYATVGEVAEYERQLQHWHRETKAVRARIDRLIKPYHDKKWKATVDKFPIEIQTSYGKPVEQRNSWDAQMAYFIGRQFFEEGGGPLKTMAKQDKEDHESLEKELAQFDPSKPDQLPPLMSIMNFDGEVVPTIVPDTGLPTDPGFLRVLSHVCGPEYPDCGPHRRSTLAGWIAAADNPLTTRVIVNRIWKQHFGRGIVESTSDFGTLGGLPSHKQLLDWLASTFVEDGWSMKRLHKRILMSATWRQSATHPHAEESQSIDPENRLLWRSEVRRLGAEQIRDAMLMISGELRTAPMGGPSVQDDQPRRALYVKSFRNTPDRFLHAFDVANGLKSVAQRSSTTTPTQALMLINGDFVLARANEMAKRIGKLDRTEDRIRFGVKLAWGRDASTDELEQAKSFLASESAQGEFDRLVDYCHVLLNSNEFLYVD